jgi:hypothetical protein
MFSKGLITQIVALSIAFINFITLPTVLHLFLSLCLVMQSFFFDQPNFDHFFLIFLLPTLHPSIFLEAHLSIH